MQKDVIYIDAEDDITAIIGKIKSSNEKIIALVPPKRVGVLQSAINLRLLERMAKNGKKRLVLITNNQALIALAAAAQIPVAKNLQSKPELAEITALSVDDGDDIIDGADLPVGEHAKSTSPKVGDHVALKPRPTRNDVVDTIAIDDETIDLPDESAPAVAVAARKASKSKVKIPNFNSFRKRVFLLGALGVVLVGALVWAFVFAPAATILVTASTSSAPVSATVKLGGTEATDYSKGIVRSMTQEIKKDEVVEFDATGQKDVGEKATGVLRLSKLSESPYGVPAGTRFTTSSGLVFVTQEAATIPAYTVCFPSLCAGSVNVDVEAVNAGTQYNAVTGSATGPDSISGTFQGSTSGGTTKVAKVVSAEDIERAKGQLIGKSTDDAKKELTSKFTNGEKVISSSFTVTRADAVSAPALDAEAPANGKAKLTINTTYTIYALPKADLETYLDAALKQQIGEDGENQRIYSNGVDKVGLSNFINNEQGITVTINADGQIGPKIDEAAIKEQIKGKITGEVQAVLDNINGIGDVEVNYSYFWVRKVPTNTDKITIEFKLQNDEE